MNITGPQYSKETKGIRSSKDIVDQQVKLVFVYPMIFDNYLSNYMNNFRDFISVNMLKEIFLSNTLNIITTASYIHPLIDEKGEKVEPQKNIQKIKFNDSGFSLSAPQQDVSREQSKYEITQRVQEKTATIRKLLQVDPKLSAFRPYVNMITLSNNIDVPVILGTKAFTVDTQVLTFMFIVAVANRPGLKFSKKSDIDKIFKIIKGTDAQGVYQLLNNLITTREISVKERLTDFFKGFVTRGKRRSLPPKQRPLPNRQELSRSNEPIEDLPREELLSYDDSFEILKGTQNKISEAQTFFNFVYEPSMLKRKFGIDLTQGQVSGAITKVNADLKNVMNSFESNFIKTISLYGDSVITSLIYLLYPAGSDVDTLRLREKHLNSSLLSEISDFINNNISKTIENSLSKKSAELADQKLSELSSLCGDDFSDSDGMLEEISRSLRHVYLKSPSFDERTLDNFLNELDKASRNASTQTARVTKSLNILLGSGTADTIISKVHSIVNEFLNQIINELRQKDPNFTSTPAARFFDESAINKLIDQAIFSIGKYLVFLFQYNFQIAICRYIKVVETEIKTAKNSVVDYPNYTLVVPVETIMAVATAFAAKKYEDLIERGESIGKVSTLIKQINDRYILGVIRYFVNTLEIPNLMVVDKKDGKLYYKLMHQSDVQKINLRTVDTYIDQLTSTVLKN